MSSTSIIPPETFLRRPFTELLGDPASQLKQLVAGDSNPNSTIEADSISTFLNEHQLKKDYLFHALNMAIRLKASRAIEAILKHMQAKKWDPANPKVLRTLSRMEEDDFKRETGRSLSVVSDAVTTQKQKDNKQRIDQAVAHNAQVAQKNARLRRVREIEEQLKLARQSGWEQKIQKLCDEWCKIHGIRDEEIPEPMNVPRKISNTKTFFKALMATLKKGSSEKLSPEQLQRRVEFFVSTVPHLNFSIEERRQIRTVLERNYPGITLERQPNEKLSSLKQQFSKKRNSGTPISEIAQFLFEQEDYQNLPDQYKLTLLKDLLNSNVKQNQGLSDLLSSQLFEKLNPADQTDVLNQFKDQITLDTLLKASIHFRNTVSEMMLQQI
jgi:hypothetical protein